MSNNVTIDTESVDRILASLSDEQTVKDILNDGLQEMATVYYNSVLSSLRKEMGAAADTPGINGKYNYVLSSGIDINPDLENTTWGVNALKDFRLLFYEGGTKQRFTKGHKITGYATNKRTGKVNYNRLQRTGKGGYRGMITANNFFSKGIVSAEQTALNALNEGIIKSIRNLGIDITG